MKKRMTKQLTESIDSLDRVVNGELEASAHLDTAEAEAYNEEARIDKHLEEVNSKLDANAKAVAPEDKKEETINVKNTYTKTYTLDESIEDFNLRDSLKEATTSVVANDVDEDDDEDIYLDFTMMDFVTSLANYGGSNHATKNPIEPGKKYPRFRADTEGGPSQLVTDGEGNVILGSDNLADFDYIMKILDYYKIDYTGPKFTRYDDFKYHLYIDVPKIAPGYPMLMVDYFEDMGMDPGDAMADKKWGERYRARQNKVSKELQAFGGTYKMERAFDDAVKYAYQRGDISLEDHLKALYSKLDGLGVRYSKASIKKKFMAEFADDFGDEE